MATRKCADWQRAQRASRDAPTFVEFVGPLALVARLEASRGTWYPADIATGAPVWIPGESRMSYASERDAVDAIDRYSARERRARGE